MKLPRKRVQKKYLIATLTVCIIALGSSAGWLVHGRQVSNHERTAASTTAPTGADIDTPTDPSNKVGERPKNQSSARANNTTDASHSDPSRLDVIVNKKHPMHPKNYVPSLVTVNCAGYGSATLSTQVKSDFLALCQAAAKAHIPLGISSSYRSYSVQINTYNNWVSTSGKAGADRYSARPGYSEHQTGLAIDFRVPGGRQLSDFTGSAQQKWLARNAWKYGFIQRYTTTNSDQTGYEAESWHFRYVGRTTAKDYTTSKATSLESYWDVSGGDY